MGRLLTYIMESLLPKRDDVFFESFEFRLCVNVPIAALILFPLSLKRDMSSLAIAGVLSVVALFYTLLVLMVEAPFYYQEYVDKPETQIYAVKIDMNILTSFSLVFFAYTCQFALMPVYSELVRPSYRRIEKVVKRAIFVDFFFYILIACAGYFSMFNATSDVVIQREPLPGYDPDYTSLAASLAICFVLFAAFASSYNPSLNQFFLMYGAKADFSNKA
jgi:amino acid permease